MARRDGFCATFGRLGGSVVRGQGWRRELLDEPSGLPTQSKALLSFKGRIGPITSRPGSDQEFAAAREEDTPVASRRNRLGHDTLGARAILDVSSSRAESLQLTPPFVRGSMVDDLRTLRRTAIGDPPSVRTSRA